MVSVAGAVVRSVPRRAMLGAGTTLTVVLLIQLAVLIHWLPSQFVPTPSAVVAAFFNLCLQSSFWMDVGYTLRGWAFGLGGALLIAVPLGLLIGSVTPLYYSTRLVVEFLRPVPSVALVPAIVLLLGVGFEAEGVSRGLWIRVAFVRQHNLRRPRNHRLKLETARCFRLSRMRLVISVVLPATLPFIMAGARISSAVRAYPERHRGTHHRYAGARTIHQPNAGQWCSDGDVCFDCCYRPARDWNQFRIPGAGTPRPALARRIPRMNRRATYLALELLTPVAIVAAIWVASRESTSIYLPPLSTILAAFVEHWVYGDGLSRDVAPSLSRMFLGFFIAAPIGIVVGLALGRLPRLRDAFDPLLEFMRAIPPAALLPVAITLFGIGTEMKVSIIALVCVWPVLINTAAGARSIDGVLLDTASVFRVGPMTRLFPDRAAGSIAADRGRASYEPRLCADHGAYQ